MSFLTTQNSVGVGLVGVVTLTSVGDSEQDENNLITESGDNLVQEDNGLILLE